MANHLKLSGLKETLLMNKLVLNVIAMFHSISNERLKNTTLFIASSPKQNHQNNDNHHKETNDS